MADYFKPKWLLWENVPGVLSSNRGLDFATLLQGLAQLGYGFAYRVLDAQYFGVPQRRRRVFVVGCLGDWRSAAKVLFESESLCRDITPRRSEGKEVAKCITTRVRNDYETETIVYENHGTDSRIKKVEVCPTMTSRWGTGGNNVPLTQSIAFDAYNNSVTGDVTKTLDTGSDYHHVPNLFQNMRVRRLTPIECERLQGFPDNYTNIPNAPDTGRYKALGNSMAVPIMRWIGERIDLQK
jgi:DNA (cytosine-5)-methyltransferase 1